ncbi:hypothetical protein AB1K18_12445 [Peribacillus simplex]|uniref:hypothetical protein n=1 Tax=Peribacillus simplex TaxID=1478 RepID=UPI003B8C9C5F
MHNEYILYASKLDKIGDLINSISNLIPVLNTDKNYTISELATYKEQLNVGTERYQFILNELRNLDVPDIINIEHGNLTQGVRSFVRGVTLMKDSIDIEERKLLVEQLVQGDSIRMITVKDVEKATKEIGDKLVGLLT